MNNSKIYFLFFILSITLQSCETFKKLDEIQEAIEKQTSHHDVNVKISSSDETIVTALLYNYKVDKFSYNELKKQAAEINIIIIITVPEWKNTKRIVKFSSATDPDKDGAIISFKFPDESSK